MTLIIDHSKDRPTTDSQPVDEESRRRIDVTDVHADGLEECIDSSVDTDCVSLQHRGGRTCLVVDDSGWTA